jgi:hypothetical protein
MDSATQIREDLEQLVATAGWQRFREYAAKEWGTREQGGGARFTMAARQAADLNAEQDAMQKLRQVCVAQREIHTLIEWVDATLKDAEKQEREPVMVADFARGGYRR